MKPKLKRGMIIGFGFTLEVLLFVLAGFTLSISIKIFSILYLIALVAATWVGKLIKQDAVQTYIEQRGKK